MCYIHTTEYYPALQRKDILILATTVQQDKYGLISISRVVKFIEIESGVVITRPEGRDQYLWAKVCF